MGNVRLGRQGHRPRRGRPAYDFYRSPAASRSCARANGALRVRARFRLPVRLEAQGPEGRQDVRREALRELRAVSRGRQAPLSGALARVGADAAQRSVAFSNAASRSAAAVCTCVSTARRRYTRSAGEIVGASPRTAGTASSSCRPCGSSLLEVASSSACDSMPSGISRRPWPERERRDLNHHGRSARCRWSCLRRRARWPWRSRILTLCR